MAAPPDILQLSKSKMHLFEKFCCISEALNGQTIESPIQTVQLTTNCFKSNFTPMVRWNQILYLMYKSNMTYNEGKLILNPEVSGIAMDFDWMFLFLSLTEFPQSTSYKGNIS